MRRSLPPTAHIIALMVFATLSFAVVMAVWHEPASVDVNKVLAGLGTVAATVALYYFGRNFRRRR